MNRTLVRSLVGAAATLVVAGAATPAFAATGDWGPLTASYSNGTAGAVGDGYTSNDRATYAANRIKVTDKKADSNTVYGKDYFSFFRLCNTEAPVWCEDARYTTAETTTTREEWHRRALRGDSEKFRVQSHVCIQMSFPTPDRCSNSAFITITY